MCTSCITRTIRTNISCLTAIDVINKAIWRPYQKSRDLEIFVAVY